MFCDSQTIAGVQKSIVALGGKADPKLLKPMPKKFTQGMEVSAADPDGDGAGDGDGDGLE